MPCGICGKFPVSPTVAATSSQKGAGTEAQSLDSQTQLKTTTGASSGHARATAKMAQAAKRASVLYTLTHRSATLLRPFAVPEASATPEEIAAMHIRTILDACAKHGGLGVLHEAGVRGTGITTAAAFHEFCRSRLGIRNPEVARTIVHLANAKDSAIHISSLLGIVRSSVYNSSPKPFQLSEPLESGNDRQNSGSSIADAQAETFPNSLAKLAHLMGMEEHELHSALLHSAIDLNASETRTEFKTLIKSLLASDLTQIKLPQGLHAPHINAQHHQEQMSYKVPVWSLRAMNQMLKRRPSSWTSSGAHALHIAACLQASCFSTKAQILQESV
jgi:hypothetical protein